MKRPCFNNIFTVAFLTIFLLVGCNSKHSSGKGQEKKEALFVKAEQAKVSAISETVDLTGNIVASKTARLASPAEGPIKGMKVREGDAVKAGAALLFIGRTEAADALLTAAQEDFKKEEEDLKAIEALVSSGALPGEQLDKARAVFARTKAQLTKAQESIEDYIIRAPWNGVVSKLLVTDGFYVAPRTVLIEMFDPGSLVLQFAVPETIITRVTRNTKIDASLDAYPGKTCNAGINRIYPDLDLKTRTKLIEASCSEKMPMSPGMFVRVRLFLRTVPDALAIPAEAIINMPDQGKAVYIVKEGKALKKRVKTGIEEGRLVQITEGINSGDKVVVIGHERLKDGAEVRIAEEKATAAKPEAKKDGQ